MNQEQYFEQFIGEGDLYYETEWHDEYAIVYSIFCHDTYINKQEAYAELARLQAKFPDYDVQLRHVHYDNPQRWNRHDGGWGPMRRLDE